METETKVKERPILMSAQLVRAILREVDPKTETRRIAKFQPDENPTEVDWFYPTKVDRKWGEEHPGELIFGVYGDDWHLKCPYGAPGERLWVRETHDIVNDPAAYHVDDGPREKTGYTCPDAVKRGKNGERWVVDYRADGNHNRIIDKAGARRWTPSIFMPRWASRINLEITDIGFERLQEITEADAIAEGFVGGLQDFVCIWATINGKDSWDQNPWVWVVKFKRIRESITTLPR